MKKFTGMTTQEVIEALNKGLRVEGRLYVEKASGEHDERTVFLPYNRKSRKTDKTLYRTANGRLYQSMRRNKMWISTKREIGWRRGAAHLLSEAQEIADFMISLERKEGNYVED